MTFTLVVCAVPCLAVIAIGVLILVTKIRGRNLHEI